MQSGAISPDLAAIQRICDAWDAGWCEGDAPALAELYTEDAVLMPQGAPEIVGRETIRALYQQVFDGYTITGGGTRLETEVVGGWAFFRSTYTLTATPKTGGEQTHDRGKWLCILKRQPGGAWKIARLITNSDLPGTG